MQTIFAHLGKLSTLLVMLASGLSWWLAPGPQTPQAAQTRVDAWTLPLASRSHTDKSAEKAVTAINAASLWGAVQTEAKEVLIDPEWRFAGITVNGREKLVMLRVEGQAMQTLKVGDQLPGGAKITDIKDDHLCLLIKGKQRKLDLFQ